MFLPKRDAWLSAILWITMLVTAGAGLAGFFDEEMSAGEAFLALGICWAGVAFIAALWFGIRYECDRSELVIHLGMVYRKRIPYRDIRRLTTVKSILSSAATSVWRIEIRYGKFGLVHISPLDYEKFLDQMKDHCPQAVIERKAF